MTAKRAAPIPKCRMFVITAQSAPWAIILRRGPTRWYHLIKWDMRSDTFHSGAWFHGRIYEEKCDLSLDGQLFLYTAYKLLKLEGTSYHCYTGLSRAPWLQALVIWPHDWGTYEGGGRFIAPRTLSLDAYGKPYPELPMGLTIDHRPSAWPRRTSTDEVEGADWSGRDHQGRLIYTVGGRLFRRVGKRDLQLADFTDEKPDPQPAPESAGRPLVGNGKPVKAVKRSARRKGK
jgi:hypothetical protein